ncbi:MAG: helix-turn-helix domain-containing protein [Verrucomicrobiales bacterium]|nr:helix-turn-helix domain-containing protein [Verrucomicrobiales bacterium]
MPREELTGAEIKAWREGIGQPRKWLAEKLGVSAKTVESWEYGVRNPSGPALRLLELLMTQHRSQKD